MNIIQEQHASVGNTANTETDLLYVAVNSALTEVEGDRAIIKGRWRFEGYDNSQFLKVKLNGQVVGGVDDSGNISASEDGEIELELIRGASEYVINGKITGAGEDTVPRPILFSASVPLEDGALQITGDCPASNSVILKSVAVYQASISQLNVSGSIHAGRNIDVPAKIRVSGDGQTQPGSTIKLQVDGGGGATFSVDLEGNVVCKSLTQTG